MAGHQVGLLGTRHANGDVGVALGQVDALEAAVELDPQRRVRLAQGRQHPAHQHRHEAGRNRDPDRAAHFDLRRAHRAQGPGRRGLHRLAGFDQGAALGRPGELAAAADQQLGVHRLLQRRQAAADGRVVDLEQARRARHRARAVKRQQDLEVTPFGCHRATPCRVRARGVERVAAVVFAALHSCMRDLQRRASTCESGVPIVAPFSRRTLPIEGPRHEAVLPPDLHDQPHHHAVRRRKPASRWKCRWSTCSPAST